jgi:hypothetical protein
VTCSRLCGGSRPGVGETAVLFEEYPIVLLVIIVVIVEVWLRVREPLFRLLGRVFGRGAAS